MPKKIFIISPSDIIQQGLSVIVNSFKNCEIILLSKCEELSQFKHLHNTNILVLLDTEQSGNSIHIQSLKTENQVKIFGIHHSGRNSSDISLFDNLLSVYSDQQLIRQSISEVFFAYKTISDSGRKKNNSELTAREKDVLELVALGHTNKEIADKLYISTHTVISHRKNITDKLGIKSISGLTVYAILNKIIDTDTIDPEKLI
jgi:DNA-binding CsgD family transcriptional regulator